MKLTTSHDADYDSYFDEVREALTTDIQYSIDLATEARRMIERKERAEQKKSG